MFPDLLKFNYFMEHPSYWNNFWGKIFIPISGFQSIWQSKKCDNFLVIPTCTNVNNPKGTKEAGDKEEPAQGLKRVGWWGSQNAKVLHLGGAPPKNWSYSYSWRSSPAKNKWHALFSFAGARLYNRICGIFFSSSFLTPLRLGFQITFGLFSLVNIESDLSGRSIWMHEWTESEAAALL